MMLLVCISCNGVYYVLSHMSLLISGNSYLMLNFIGVYACTFAVMSCHTLVSTADGAVYSRV